MTASGTEEQTGHGQGGGGASLVGHNRPEVQQTIRGTFGTLEPLQSSDIADAVVYAVIRPRHVGVNEILVRPTMQER
jgi:NADP-dependent 3-hydroxy acid dehydrogenase YdfG